MRAAVQRTTVCHTPGGRFSAAPAARHTEASRSRSTRATHRKSCSTSRGSTGTTGSSSDRDHHDTAGWGAEFNSSSRQTPMPASSRAMRVPQEVVGQAVDEVCRSAPKSPVDVAARRRGQVTLGEPGIPSEQPMRQPLELQPSQPVQPIAAPAAAIRSLTHRVTGYATRAPPAGRPGQVDAPARRL